MFKFEKNQDKYTSVNCRKNAESFSIDRFRTQFKEYVDNFESELKQIMEKIENVKNERTNNIEIINIEMSNEINNLIKKINDTSLDLILSNSDKANAIQDIIKIYLNKFKISKNEFNEFEDKITKLISELLDKVILLRKGSQ